MSWYRNPKIISAIIFLVLMALIWFAGPYIGLKTLEARFICIFLIMVVWIIILAVGKIIRERSASLFEKVLRRKADDAVISASPESRAEVAMLRQRLLSAIETLKTSNLGKTRGRAALYELPWYMIVGHPAAGKSCAILNSGLKFPLAGKAGGASIQGIGGTRNCDWFFSTEGVLLDTAGRYSTQGEDRIEWLEFLKLLKKNRSRAPLNGILVAISFPELAQHHTEAFATYARQIRQRINEVDDIFGMKVPVYLVFTKIDLLRGFTQFFEDLSEEERQHVWGATLDHEQAEAFDAPGIVGQHFEVLYKGLAQLGTDKLASTRDNLSRPALFAFPLEFHGLKEAVCKFVGHLVEKDPYHTKPLIRGFYFTSALQENSPTISFVNRVSNQFDLTKFNFKPSQLTGSSPFFLESLFRKVIFPDLHLVGRQTNPKRNRARLAGMVAGIVALGLLTSCWTRSFIGNQQLISESREELTVARKLLASQELGDKLKGLQVLQIRLEQLYQYRQDGNPWSIGWGLYRGRDVEKVLRAEYFSGLRQTMLEPVKGRLEEHLTKSMEPQPAPIESTPAPARRRGLQQSTILTLPPAAPQAGMAKGLEEHYNALKTYLMLHSRSRMESTHLTDQIARYWRPWLEQHTGKYPVPEINRMAERMVAFYVSQIKEADLPTIENRQELVAAVRSHLRDRVSLLSPLERIYNELKAQGNTNFAPMTVARILNNKDMDLVGASAAVSGSFTREAWDKHFREAIEQAAKGEFKGTDWVLASSLEDSNQKGSVDENRAKLMALYRADYIKEWEKFLQGVVFHPYSDPERAANALGRFGDPQSSPIKLILARAAQETSWDNPSELNKTLQNVKKGIVQRTETLLGGVATGGSPGNAQLGEVGGRFAALSQIVTPSSPGGRAPIDGYLELLQKAKGKLAGVSSSGDPGESARQLVQATLNGSGSELAEAQQYMDNTLLGGMSDSAKETLRPILARPLIGAFGSVVPVAEQDINRAWSQQVYSQWGNLAGKYPFADTTNDAQMADISRFLKPGEGTLARFVDKYLNGIVTRRADSMAPRTWGGQGINFSGSFLHSVAKLLEAGNALFRDNESCKFELWPNPTNGLSEIRLDIDGQRIVYRNGHQAWAPITWPGNSGAQGSSIQATSNTGATTVVHSSNGRLGWMRLMDQARIEGPASSVSVLEWRFKAPKAFSSKGTQKDGAREEFYPHPIRFSLRTVSGANPLRFNLLRHHSLPARIGN